MNIPITSRVKRAGKKGCDCQCEKTPAKKALVGNQNQLPQELQDAIKAAPAKMWGAAKVAHGAKAVAKNYKKGYYGK